MIKTIELERETKVKFEHVHVKNKKEAEELDNSKGKIMVMKCGVKSKEERVKYEDQHKN